MGAGAVRFLGGGGGVVGSTQTGANRRKKTGSGDRDGTDRVHGLPRVWNWLFHTQVRD